MSLLGWFGAPMAFAQPGTSLPACEARGSHQWLSTRPSPLDSVTLTTRGAVAKICYSRPSLRGRSVDSLVPPRFAWRMGANEPTLLFLTRALNVGGGSLAAGRYVILAVPGAERWTLVFNTTPDSEPTRMFKNLTQVGTATGRVERVPDKIEQFTIRVQSDVPETAFLLEWGNWRVVVPVRAP
jgi:hypothetical protein